MNRTLVIFFFFIITFSTQGQELLLNSFKYSASDISARENQMMDINNEPCALLKIRIGIKDLTISSNLSIEKIEQKVGEYWVWVSPRTTILKISAPEFPLNEIVFPVPVEPNNVYIIIVTAIFPQKILYQDSATRYISFVSKPESAEVFIDNVYQGKTPIKINIPKDVYSYRLDKKKYLSITGIDGTKEKTKQLDLTLPFDHKYKRYFTSISIGVSDGSVIPGIVLGQVGKTGWYLSSRFTYQNVSPEVEIYSSQSEFFPIKRDINGYWYETGIFGFTNTLFLSAGINQQIFNVLFINLGLGYSQSKSYLELTKIPYSTEEVPGTFEWYAYVIQDAYGLLKEESYNGFNVDFGITGRILEKLLLSVSATSNFDGIGLKNHRQTLLSFGLGYNF